MYCCCNVESMQLALLSAPYNAENSSRNSLSTRITMDRSATCHALGMFIIFGGGRWGGGAMEGVIGVESDGGSKRGSKGTSE